MTLRIFSSAGKGRTVKRPEGRAPAALGWGAKQLRRASSPRFVSGTAFYGDKRPRPCSLTFLNAPSEPGVFLQTAEGYARRSRLVRAENPSTQTWLYL